MIEMAWTPSLIGAFASGIILGAFSIVVGVLARFRGPAKWYAIFGASFAASNVFFNLAEAIRDAHDSVLALTGQDLVAYRILIVAGTLFIVPWIAGVVKLIHCYNDGRDSRIGWTVAGLAGLLVSVIGVLTWADSQQDALWALRFRVANVLFVMAVAWMAVAPWLMARARLRNPQPGQAILAIALAAYPLIRVGQLLVRGGMATTELDAVTVLVHMDRALLVMVAFVGLVAGWLKVGLKEQTRLGLKMVGAGGFFLVLGFMAGMYWEQFPASGVARFFDVVLVAYAILRLQYLGLDIKVRWGISKSTVAAAFVAAFFIVSEGAQQFFGDRFNNNYAGIAAAGALVLGISPLQRWADRFAETAVPVGAGRIKNRSSNNLRLYRTLAKRLAADGELSATDRRTLAYLAQEMQIGAGDVHDVLEKVDGRR